MAGSQRKDASFAQRFGYGLGQAARRVRASWHAFEQRLVQRAGRRAQLVEAGLLLFKSTLMLGAVLAAIFAAFWLVVIIVGVLTLITFGGNSMQSGSAFGGEYRYGSRGYDWYSDYEN